MAKNILPTAVIGGLVALSFMLAGAAGAAEFNEWDADSNAELNAEEFGAGFGASGVYDEWDRDATARCRRTSSTTACSAATTTIMTASSRSRSSAIMATMSATAGSSISSYRRKNHLERPPAPGNRSVHLKCWRPEAEGGKPMISRRIALAAAGLLFSLSPFSAAAQSNTAATLTVQDSPEHGTYVADGDGRALYMFEADQRGQGNAKAVSNCSGACAEAWPPLIVQGTPAAGDQVQADLIATISRPDGTMQATYGGWPLYYYVKDQGAGQTTGHDVEGFGAEWYLVTASGEIVGH